MKTIDKHDDNVNIYIIGVTTQVDVEKKRG